MAGFLVAVAHQLWFISWAKCQQNLGVWKQVDAFAWISDLMSLERTFQRNAFSSLDKLQA